MTNESSTLFTAKGYPGNQDPDNQLPAVPYFVNSTGPGMFIVHRSDPHVTSDDPKPFKGWLSTFEEIVD
jgi:hypothetical protein